MDEESTPTKCFVRVAVPENICLQCGGLVENAALRIRLFSGSNKTKTCQNLELLLGDLCVPSGGGEICNCLPKLF